MKIGYACLVVGVPDTTMKTTRKANATPERLTELIQHNLASMENMIAYNIKHGIKMYRISSDIIPFGSDLETNQLDWASLFSETLKELGKEIKAHNIRVSMHPGQYTVLNSLDADVVERAILDLEYHTQFLDALDVDDSHKIILHIGGVYGDKEAAKSRFIEVYKRLSDRVRARLIIENDHSLYTISDVLEVSEATGAPNKIKKWLCRFLQELQSHFLKTYYNLLFTDFLYSFHSAFNNSRIESFCFKERSRCSTSVTRSTKRENLFARIQ